MLRDAITAINIRMRARIKRVVRILDYSRSISRKAKHCKYNFSILMDVLAVISFSPYRYYINKPSVEQAEQLN